MCCGQAELKTEPAVIGGKWWAEVCIGSVRVNFGSERAAEEFLAVEEGKLDSTQRLIQSALRFQKELAA